MATPKERQDAIQAKWREWNAQRLRVLEANAAADVLLTAYNALLVQEAARRNCGPGRSPDVWGDFKTVEDAKLKPAPFDQDAE